MRSRNRTKGSCGSGDHCNDLMVGRSGGGGGQLSSRRYTAELSTSVSAGRSGRMDFQWREPCKRWDGHYREEKALAQERRRAP